MLDNTLTIKDLLMQYLYELFVIGNLKFKSLAHGSDFLLYEINNNALYIIVLSSNKKRRIEISAILDVFIQYVITESQTIKDYNSYNRNRTYCIAIVRAFYESLKRSYVQLKSEGIFDPEYLEGVRYLREQEILSRNKNLVKMAKERDDYTCQACGFKKLVNDNYIIDCHHIVPLYLGANAITKLSDLVCLCPNCHRAAHSSLLPLSLEDIKNLIVHK